MPTTLGPKYAVDWRGRPPHMLDPDIPVWYRFLLKYGHLFKSLYYDCLLGGNFLSPEQLKDPLEVGWNYNISKRADAIAELDDENWLIEVASFPGLRAAGQLLTYQTLWDEDPKLAGAMDLILVGERIDPDLAASMSKFSIQIYLV